MRIVDVHARQPRTVIPILLDKLDRFLRAPRRLVIFGGNTIHTFGEFPQHFTLFTHPVGVVVSDRPIVPRSVAVLPVRVSVVRTWLDSAICARQMQLPYQTAIVPLIRQHPRHQRRNIIRKNVVAVPIHPDRAGIEACQKARPTRRTDRALTVCRVERHPTSNETIDVRSRHNLIPERRDRIVPLLIRTDPKDVRPIAHAFTLARLALPFVTARGRSTMSRPA